MSWVKKIWALLAVAVVLTAFWQYTDPRRTTLSGDRVLIRFWNGFTGPDGRRMVQLVRRFNEEHPDIQVQLQRIAWATYYNKIFVSGLGGRSPDVFVLHATVLPRFARAGLLVPLEEWLAKEGAPPVDDFAERAWEAVQYEGRPWGIPLDVHPFGMYGNRTLFREAGLVDESGEILIPETREELLHAMRALTRDTTGDGRTDQWGYVLTTLRMIFQSIMPQMGGDLVSPDGRTVLMNSPENERVLEFLLSLINEERVAPNPEGFDSWIGFRQGRVGIVFEGIYMFTELARSGLDFFGAPFPVIGDRPAAWADAHVLCLSSSAGQREREAGWKFITFLSEQSADWGEVGQVPVRISVLESEQFQSMETQRAFAERLPHLYFTPAVPYKLELDTELELALESVLRGTMTPAAALQRAEVNIQRIIDRVFEGEDVQAGKE